jgi:hypothetical protein
MLKCIHATNLNLSHIYWLFNKEKYRFKRKIVAPPVKFSGENIGTSREVITELSNLIMTVIVAYDYYICDIAWLHDTNHLFHGFTS